MTKLYIESHPWINFRLEIGEAPSLWLLLGEAKSKCVHISGVPLPPDVADRLHKLSLVKGIAGTTAIEGNTLTEAEVEAQLAGTLQLPPSREYLRQEVQNVLDACGQITTDVFNQETRLTPELIHGFNRLVLRGLELEPHIIPGKIRTYSVTAGRYRGAPAEDCNFLLEKTCDWLNEFNPEGYPAIVVAIVKAVLAHLYIAWIHPYGDGNGRTARLIEVYLLLSAGVPTPAAHLLSNHYNETRSQYYSHLDSARRDPSTFVRYAVDGFVEGLKWQLLLIRNYQWKTAWHDFLRSQFDLEKKMDQRRFLLLTSLPAVGQTAVSPSEASELTPQLASLYAKLAPKTVYRDIAALEEQELLMVLDGKVVARMDRVTQFLPLRKTDPRGLFDAFLPTKLVDAMITAAQQHRSA